MGLWRSRVLLAAIQTGRSGYAVWMLYLASRSPRRSQLLARLGLAFHTLELDVPEHRQAGEAPADYVLRVATEKALAGLVQVRASDPTAHVLGSDTEVVLGDRVYGKPADAADAHAMLASLTGRTHQVITAVVLARGDGLDSETVISEVTFAELDEATLATYAASGEPLGKAGGYAIQGGAECFIRHLAGSYSGVMGLPLYQTSLLLQRAGLSRPTVSVMESVADV